MRTIIVNLFGLCLWIGLKLALGTVQDSGATELVSDSDSDSHSTRIRHKPPFLQWNHKKRSDKQEFDDNVDDQFDVSFGDVFQKWLIQALSDQDDSFALQRQLREALLKNETGSVVSLRRTLSTGKWKEFNRLFEHASLHLPSITIEEQLGLKLELDINDAWCQDIEVEDLELIVTTVSPREVKIKVNLKELDIFCTAPYVYAYGSKYTGWARGRGEADVYTKDNHAEAEITFSTGSSFEVEPPTSVSVEVLLVKFYITDIDVRGGFVAKILDTFEKIFREFAEDQLQKASKSELSALGAEFLRDVIADTQLLIEPYLQPIPSDLSDPSKCETDFLSETTDVDDFLCFQDLSDGSIASLIADLLGEADKMFGKVVADPFSPTGNGYDLAVNQFVRKNLLDSDRKLSMLIEDLPFEPFDATIFSSHDIISKTEIILKGFTFEGLDTFKRFDALVDIGCYTLQNAFHLDTMKVDVDLLVNIKPSDLEDALLRGVDMNTTINEQIQVSFGLDDLNVILGIFLVLQEGPLLSMQLGSLLRQENIVACVASLIHELKISGLAVSVGNIHEPVLDGFISDGIDDLVTNAVDAVFRMYEPTFLKSLSHIFQSSVRDILQKEMLAAIDDFASTSKCDWEIPTSTTEQEKYMDFRDFFLDTASSLLLGGSGKEPYGDLGPIGYDLFQRTVHDTDSVGRLGFNDLVDLATKAQSGMPGILIVPDTELVSMSNRLLEEDSTLNLWKNLVTGVDLSVRDVVIRNLNTVTTPLALVKPSTDATSLTNEINVGNDGSSDLVASARFLIVVEGPSPLALKDEIEFTLSMGSLSLIADVVVRMSTLSFLSFPLEEVLNFNCWLAVVPEFEPEQGYNVAVDSIVVEMTNVLLSSYVISGTSAGIQVLPTGLSVLDDTGFIDILTSRLQGLLGDVLQTNTTSGMIDNKVREARAKCPSSSFFDPNFTEAIFQEVTPLSLSAGTIDTLVFGALGIGQLLVIALMENHLHFDGVMPESITLSGNPDQMVDWTDLEASLGLDTVADEAFARVRDFVKGVGDDGELNINKLVNDLSDNGDFVFEPSDVAVDIGDLTLKLASITLGGLNSFSSIDLMNPQNKTKLSNLLSLDELRIRVVVDIISAESGQQMDLSFSMKDIQIQLDLIAGFDAKKVLEIQLGSLLFVEDILPCFLSAGSQIGIETFLVSFGELNVPEISGLMPETQSSMNQTIAALYDLFINDVVAAVPILMNTTVKQLANNIIEAFVADNQLCTDRPVNPGAVLDFRELLLGYGNGTFGTLGVELYAIAEQLLTDVDSNGKLRLNEMVIETITKLQSGTPGSFDFSGTDLISLETKAFESDSSNILSDLVTGKVELGFGSIRFDNLNTVVPPIQLLQTTDHPQVLINELNMGSNQFPDLQASARLRMYVETDTLSPLSIDDELEFEVSLDMLKLLANITARVNASSFMTFPMQHLFNLDCWLSLFSVQEAGHARNLVLEAALELTELVMGAEVVAGSSPGIQTIPTSMGIIQDSGSITIISARLGSLMEELSDSNTITDFIGNRIREGHFNCPSSEFFNETFDFGSVESFSMSEEALDTLIYTAVLFVHVPLFVILENHLYFNESSSSSAPSRRFDRTLVALDEPSAYLDWTDLSGLGLGEIPDEALKLGRDFISGRNDDGELNANVFLRDFFAETGVVSFDLEDASFEVANGLSINLTFVRIGGLDTFTSINVLDPVDPQTLLNELSLGELLVDVDFQLASSTSTSNVSVSFKATDVEFAVEIFAAFFVERLLDTKLGSLLHTKDILPCFMSAADAIEINQLVVNVGAFGVPSITGLMAETENSLNQTLGDLYEHFEVEESIPKIFNTTIKQLLNSFLEKIVEDPTCPDRSAEVDDQLIALSEIFESNEMYGDLLVIVRNFVDSEYLLAQDESGMSALNDLLGPFTKRQSGHAGKLYFPSSLFDEAVDTLFRVGVRSLEFALGNITVDNLDTLKAPVVLLEPSEEDPSILMNQIRFGANQSPLRVMLNGMLGSSGDQALSSLNELELGLDFIFPEVLASIKAQVRSGELMSFPLKELTNFNCWLALFGAPSLDDNGERLPGEEPGLSIQNLSLAVEALQLYAACRESGTCTTSGLPILDDVLSVFDRDGVTTFLADRLLGFVNEITPFFQTFLDRLLVDASQQCENQNKTTPDRRWLNSFPLPSLPPVSNKMLDSIVYAATYFFEAAIVVIFESHESYTATDIDPLADQSELTKSAEGLELIDFSDLTASVGSWADSLFEQVRNFAKDANKDGDGNLDYGMNIIMRAALLDEEGLMVFDLSDVYLDEPFLRIALGNLTIRGLDTMKNISLLNAIGPQTLQNSVVLEDVAVGLQVVVKTTEAEMDGYIELSLRDLHLDTSILLGIIKNDLGNLELGQMLDSDHVFRCLISSVHSVSVPVLNATFGGIKSFRLEGFNDPEVTKEVERVTGITLEEYGEIILSNSGRFFDFTIKAVLNNYISYMMSQESTSFCPKPSRSLGAANDGSTLENLSIVDLRDLLLPPSEAASLGGSGQEPHGDMFFTLVEMLKENVLKINPSTGLSSVNSMLISQLTESQSGVAGKLFFPGDLIEGGIDVKIGGMDLTVDFRLYDAFIANLDTIGSPFSLLDPVKNKPSNLNNTATVGLGDPFQIGTRLFLSISDANKDIVNDVEVVLSIEKLLLVLEALLRLSEDRFNSLPLKELISTDCLLSVMDAPRLDTRGIRMAGEEPSAGLEHLGLSLSSLKLNVTCVGDCSPGMEDLGERLSTEEASEASTNVANKVLDYATDMLGGSYLEVTIDRMINDAHRSCPSSPYYDENAIPLSYAPFELAEDEGESVRFLMMLGISAVCIICALLLVMGAVKTIVYCRHEIWLRSLPHGDLKNILQKQTKAVEKETDMNQSTRSMFRSPAIPLSVRMAMPVIILANVGFFLSGHLNLGGTVNIILQLGGENVRVDNFFEFSIMKSTIEIWNAGGTELAIMILIFSVIWPYTKQAITLFLWFAGPNVVSISRRGSWLLWLDTLAKWSMVDIMTLVVTVAAFRVSIQSPDVAFLPDGFYSVDLVVVPLWGLYSNMIAQLISQISSHFIIYYHRRIEKQASTSYDRALSNDKSSLTLVMDCDDTDDDSSLSASNNANAPTTQRSNNEVSIRLCTHAFHRPHRTDSDKLLVRRIMNPVVVVAFFAVTLMVLAGCILPSFSVEIMGLVGVIVESGQAFSEAKTEHSVFTIVQLLREQSEVTGRLADKIGLGSLSALLVFSVLVVPITQAAVLVYVWFASMGAQRRRTLAVVVETLQAWQYAEVYLLSVIVASWQLGPVSNFMINSYCNTLDEFFAQLVYHGILKEEDAQCFRVEAKVESASYALAAGAVALALVNTFVIKAVVQYFRDLEQQGNNSSVAIAHPVVVDDVPDDDEMNAVVNKIRPVPVLFTDTFRWCLVREDTVHVEAEILDGEEEKHGNTNERSIEELNHSVEEPSTIAWKEEEMEISFLPQATTRQYDESYGSDSCSQPRPGAAMSLLSSDSQSSDSSQADTAPDVEVDNVQRPHNYHPQSTGPPTNTEFEYMMDTLYTIRGDRSVSSCDASVTSRGSRFSTQSSVQRSVCSRSSRSVGIEEEDDFSADKPDA